MLEGFIEFGNENFRIMAKQNLVPEILEVLKKVAPVNTVNC